MKIIFNQLRLILSDTLLEWSLRVMPTCEEQEDLAYLITYYMKERIKEYKNK